MYEDKILIRRFIIRKNDLVLRAEDPGISDLILASRTAANRDASLLPMFVAGAIYLILIGIVTIVSKRVEKRYNYDRR